ncbi:MAG: hypothetical protein ABFD10_14970 [Prolixibacteraceae bacterium]
MKRDKKISSRKVLKQSKMLFLFPEYRVARLQGTGIEHRGEGKPKTGTRIFRSLDYGLNIWTSDSPTICLTT